MEFIKYRPSSGLIGYIYNLCAEHGFSRCAIIIPECNNREFWAEWNRDNGSGHMMILASEAGLNETMTKVFYVDDSFHSARALHAILPAMEVVYCGWDRLTYQPDLDQFSRAVYLKGVQTNPVNNSVKRELEVLV